ncbi:MULTISPECIES: DMT family transporter [unclassified Pseudoalteromonas]|uniref:DMT family transporter n=1 Tax=unclassified Pseudoalteromonas TaxID=194690 RepID=UPI0020979F6D|nr:DMT family transporter [Pseudoalteromonas sp. XMcav2-N]MCO7188930.1 DMT family transporter [Pseudoalteromonas sp. XMcav2-N]
MIGIGEGAAISAAFVWAFSTLLYKRFSHHLSPFELNVSKGVIASALMALCLFIAQDTLYPAQSSSWAWLIASGILGIAIGDSAYFAALRNIGPARTLVIESLAPAIAGILNILVLGVYLGPVAWLGIAVTTFGVILAIKPNKAQPLPDKTHYLLGVTFALTAATCQAAGMVLSKGALINEDISSLWAALIRLASGTLFVACLVACLKSHSLNKALTLKQISGKRWLFIAVFFGTFIGLWLQLVSVNNTDPAIAQTIFATAPLMVMTLSLIRKEAVTKAMLCGGAIALFGVFLLLQG